MSDFELCVQIADQTIAMTDWLAESSAHVNRNVVRPSPVTVSLNAVSTGPRRRISMRQIDAGDRCERHEMPIVAPKRPGDRRLDRRHVGHDGDVGIRRRVG